MTAVTVGEAVPESTKARMTAGRRSASGALRFVPRRAPDRGQPRLERRQPAIQAIDRVAGAAEFRGDLVVGVLREGLRFFESPESLIKVFHGALREGLHKPGSAATL